MGAKWWVARIRPRSLLETAQLHGKEQGVTLLVSLVRALLEGTVCQAHSLVPYGGAGMAHPTALVYGKAWEKPFRTHLLLFHRQFKVKIVCPDHTPL